MSFLKKERRAEILKGFAGLFWKNWYDLEIGGCVLRRCGPLGRTLGLGDKTDKGAAGVGSGRNAGGMVRGFGACAETWQPLPLPECRPPRGIAARPPLKMCHRHIFSTLRGLNHPGPEGPGVVLMVPLPPMEKAVPTARLFPLVGAGGFEPPKSSTTDLQSAPFGHSGTLPYAIVTAVISERRWSW